MIWTILYVNLKSILLSIFRRKKRPIPEIKEKTEDEYRNKNFYSKNKTLKEKQKIYRKQIFTKTNNLVQNLIFTYIKKIYFQKRFCKILIDTKANG